MRIGFATDFDFSQRPGGASRATDLWLASAPVDLDVVPCSPGNLDRECDAYILVLTKLFSDEELTFLLSRPFLRIELDYWPGYESQSKWRAALNGAARHLLFVSPLHRQVYAYRHQLSAETLVKSSILPPPMDPGMFTLHREWADAHVERKDAICFSEWTFSKGVDVAMKWALLNRTVLDMYSPSMPAGQDEPNEYVKIHHFMPQENWWDEIARHKQFVHFPRQPECFPYSVLEAYLLGCEVIMSGRLGVESYGISFEELIQMASQSRARLWDIAQDVLA